MIFFWMGGIKLALPPIQIYFTCVILFMPGQFPILGALSS